jgi:hypothetical protein
MPPVSRSTPTLCHQALLPPVLFVFHTDLPALSPFLSALSLAHLLAYTRWASPARAQPDGHVNEGTPEHISCGGHCARKPAIEAAVLKLNLDAGHARNVEFVDRVTVYLLFIFFLRAMPAHLRWPGARRSCRKEIDLQNICR